MFSVAKPWLICGYHIFFVLFVLKPWLIFIREYPDINVLLLFYCRDCAIERNSEEKFVQRQSHI